MITLLTVKIQAPDLRNGDVWVSPSGRPFHLSNVAHGGDSSSADGKILGRGVERTARVEWAADDMVEVLKGGAT